MSVVAIQGVRGSYSEEAVVRILGDGAEIVECSDFVETFTAIGTKRAEYAVVPVENKTVGKIEGSMSLLRAGGYRIFERLPLKSMHVLAGTPDADLAGLRSVGSQAEALNQCSRFLVTNSNWQQIIGADTASSIRRVVEEGNRANAAICSRRAARIYGARVLQKNIADDHDNWTTFYLIGS